MGRYMEKGEDRMVLIGKKRKTEKVAGDRREVEDSVSSVESEERGDCRSEEDGSRKRMKKRRGSESNLTNHDCEADNCLSRRSSSPISEQASIGSSKKKSCNISSISGRNSSKMPSAEEIEEFFAAAEKYEQERFVEKYNYDIVKDVPLQGKYQWVRLNQKASF